MIIIQFGHIFDYFNCDEPDGNIIIDPNVESKIESQFIKTHHKSNQMLLLIPFSDPSMA